ncbi:MAG: GNAT family N-acetyltransferase [Chloroflexi bacterium]|nr:GNAT family N-acetyltransferase [Chloroflexota bacterium]
MIESCGEQDGRDHSGFRSGARSAAAQSVPVLSLRIQPAWTGLARPGGWPLRRKRSDDCWEPGCRRIFAIRVDGAWAGFIIVDLDLPDGDNPPVNEMSEFFVMPPYRRQGVGETAARWAFDQFPGRWEVAIVDSNAEALVFWRRVLARFPADPVAEVHRPEERDYLLTFDNSPK